MFGNQLAKLHPANRIFVFSASDFWGDIESPGLDFILSFSSNEMPMSVHGHGQPVNDPSIAEKHV